MRHKVPPVAVTKALNWALLHLPIEGRLLTDDSWRHKVVKFLSGADQRLTYEQLDAVYEQIPNFITVCKYSVTPLVYYHDLRRKAARLRLPTLLITTDEDPRATPCRPRRARSRAAGLPRRSRRAPGRPFRELRPGRRGQPPDPRVLRRDRQPAPRPSWR